MEKEKFEKWQKMVLEEQGFKNWKVKNTGKGDGVCLSKSKTIICTPNSYALFLHEVAHAIVPKEKLHGGIWADLFTALCKEYLIPK